MNPLEVTISQNGIPASEATTFFLKCAVTLSHWNITSFPPTINFTGPFTGDDKEGSVTMINKSTYVRRLQFNSLQTSHSGVYNCSVKFTELNFTSSKLQQLTVISKCRPILHVIIFRHYCR